MAQPGLAKTGLRSSRSPQNGQRRSLLNLDLEFGIASFCTIDKFKDQRTTRKLKTFYGIPKIIEIRLPLDAVWTAEAKGPASELSTVMKDNCLPVSPYSRAAGTMFDNQLVRPIPIEVLGRDEPDTVGSAITSPLSIEDQDRSVVHFRT